MHINDLEGITHILSMLGQSHTILNSIPKDEMQIVETL